MPRYFFDVVSQGDVSQDRDGVDIEDGSDLRVLASERAGELIRTAVQTQPPEWWLMEVKNSKRETIGRLSFVVSGFADASDAARAAAPSGRLDGLEVR